MALPQILGKRQVVLCCGHSFLLTCADPFCVILQILLTTAFCNVRRTGSCRLHGAFAALGVRVAFERVLARCKLVKAQLADEGACLFHTARAQKFRRSSHWQAALLSGPSRAPTMRQHRSKPALLYVTLALAYTVCPSAAQTVYNTTAGQFEASEVHLCCTL